MPATFYNATAFEDENLIRVANGAQSVRDDEGSAALHETIERLLDETLGFSIHGSGGFVENEDGRIFQQRSRDGDALFFADAELHTALADHCIHAVWQSLDEIARVRILKRLP